MKGRQGGPSSQRSLRVGEELRHALARILAEGKLRDPELAGRAATVTEVRVTADLRSATAYVVPFGGGDAAPLVAALNRAAPYLRARLAETVALRYSPTLRFRADDSFDVGQRVLALLREPAVLADLAGEDSGDG